MIDNKAAISRLAGLSLRLRQGILDFEAANRPRIDDYWQATAKGNPRLWNGPFFMFEDVRIESGILRGTARQTDFATFLYWRDNGRPGGVTHITGTSLPVMADGTLFAVRMAAHTANPGSIYFPAGSFDAADIVDGRFDVTANIARELAEETGLEFREADAEDGLTAVRAESAVHVARRNRLPFDFAEGLRRLERHQAETGDDEIETAVAVMPEAQVWNRLKPYAHALAAWHFENDAFTCSGK